MGPAAPRTSSVYLLPLAAALLLGVSGCSRSEPSQPAGGSASAPSGRPAGPGAGAPQRPPTPVEVYPVQIRALRESLVLVGSLAANESAEVRAEIAGRVERVLFEEGKPVRAGQPLIQLDAAELSAQLAAAKASLALADSNLQRVRPLVGDGTRAQTDLDRAQADFDKATADVRLLEVRLSRMVLRAPFDGVAGARLVSPGDYLTSSTLVTTVEDLSALKVEFEVPETALSQLKPGNRFTVTARGLPENSALEGEVYFVSPALDRSTRSSLVRGLVREPKSLLKPGMFVMIDLTLATRERATVVPESAVLARQSGFAIVRAVEREGRKVAEFVPVRLGVRERGIVEVIPLKGELEEGAEVVASGVGAVILIPGDALAPRPLNPRLAPAPAS